MSNNNLKLCKKYSNFVKTKQNWVKVFKIIRLLLLLKKIAKKF